MRFHSEKLETLFALKTHAVLLISVRTQRISLPMSFNRL